MSITSVTSNAVVSTGKVTKVGIVGLLGLLWRYKVIFLFIFFTLPIIVHSVSYAIETKNPIYPATELGLYIINSDVALDNLVNDLRTKPEEIIGTKPGGIIGNSKYYANLGFLIYRIAGLVFGIAIPFILLFRYFRFQGQQGNQSSNSKDIMSALKVGFVFILIVNTIFLVIGAIEGTIFIDFAPGISGASKALIVLVKALPFHGLFNLIMYLAGVNIPNILPMMTSA